MSALSVTLVSAFGRGETLALALFENGFQVKVLDFTGVFGPEYQRGMGPFPILDKAFIPAQREVLSAVEPQPQGFTLWLKDGPVELTGPFSGVHLHSRPEVQAWKTNSMSGDFAKTWLQSFLRQFTSPFFAESWSGVKDAIFPAELPLGNLPAERENHSHTFDRLNGKRVEVLECAGLKDVQVGGNRIAGVEVEEAGKNIAIGGENWIWCLSSSETEKVGAEAAAKIFGREIFKPEWAWLSFGGSMSQGPWVSGLPRSFVLIGDEYLPWYYANMSILRHSDDGRFRVWIKVPRARVGDIDARRAWAGELQKLLQARLPLAGWKIESSDWNLCPHSEVYGESQRGVNVSQFRNCSMITPETLPRLDLSARFEMEAETFHRLVQMRNELAKKGGRNDQALHAP